MARITVLDGGTGRELKRIGAPFRQPEWSALALIEAPQFVTRVHEAYVAAGADVITTNSYAIVPFHIGAERFQSEGRALAKLAGRLARAVADRASRPVAVAGCLPPTCGSYLAERFDAAVARPILQTLVEALRPHVDYWLGETLSLIAEAELIRETVGPAISTDAKPLWLSFALEDEAGPAAPARLRSGESVADAVAAAVRLDAAALLFNCSRPEVMGAAVTEAKTALSRLASGAATMQIGVYANAFQPQDAGYQSNESLSGLRAEVTPAAYLDWARDWVARGATIVGGCCGIGPEHITALRAGL